ncbi:EF-hand domain-containing protein [Roseibacterium sp. SDUM158016]|uniref:EF-hand domain-containing protein n=1 Tax=Roseicyclus sediminis TaxID=2980997 RepID=UPI0021CFBE6E|nr:EF-hand domain-containing protein [Roseibacterium sp. SDUM158016]MCU4653535.1 EF-hand domain-containing protein [Roseibacterium sp. SDUM158016]
MAIRQTRPDFSTATRRRGGLRLAPAAMAGIVLGTLVGAGLAMGQAETLDGDGDGMVSYEELLVAVPDLTEDGFTAMDTDADGLLSAEEVAAAVEAGMIPAG